MYCKYCNDGVLIWNNDYSQGWLSDLSTLLIFDEGTSSTSEVDINFCPMCGEKLGDD